MDGEAMSTVFEALEGGKVSDCEQVVETQAASVAIQVAEEAIAPPKKAKRQASSVQFDKESDEDVRDMLAFCIDHWEEMPAELIPVWRDFLTEILNDC